MATLFGRDQTTELVNYCIASSNVASVVWSINVLESYSHILIITKAHTGENRGMEESFFLGGLHFFLSNNHGLLPVDNKPGNEQGSMLILIETV